MKIKTFPLQFTEDKLDKIGNVADKLNMSKKDFILEAIDEKMEEVD